jgi:hypothetical protein
MKINEVHFKSNHVGIYWQKEGFGWGVLSLSKTADGSIEIDAETLSKTFVKEVLNALVDEAKLIG